MRELLVIAEQEPDGGWVAHAVDAAIFTEADTEEELRSMVMDAVRVHFDDDERPHQVRLRFVREELLGR